MISVQWNFTQLWSRTNCWYREHGSISVLFCWVKEPRYQTVHTVQLYLYKILENANQPTESESRSVVACEWTGRDGWTKRGQEETLGSDWRALYPDSYYWFHRVHAFVKLPELCVLNRYRFWYGNYTSINLFLNTIVSTLKPKWIFVHAHKGLIVQKSKMHDSVSVLYNKGLDKGLHRDHDLWPLT